VSYYACSIVQAASFRWFSCKITCSSFSAKPKFFGSFTTYR